MTNDAKLGLVVGIGLVILIAIVFFRKDGTLAHAAPAPARPLPQSRRGRIPLAVGRRPAVFSGSPLPSP